MRRWQIVQLDPVTLSSGTRSHRKLETNTKSSLDVGNWQSFEETKESFIKAEGLKAGVGIRVGLPVSECLASRWRYGAATAVIKLKLFILPSPQKNIFPVLNKIHGVKIGWKQPKTNQSKNNDYINNIKNNGSFFGLQTFFYVYRPSVDLLCSWQLYQLALSLWLTRLTQ